MELRFSVSERGTVGADTLVSGLTDLDLARLEIARTRRPAVTQSTGGC